MKSTFVDPSPIHGLMGIKQAAEKGFFMLRQAQHEWKYFNVFETSSVRLEPVER
jgi:hypothetical protein